MESILLAALDEDAFFTALCSYFLLPKSSNSISPRKGQSRSSEQEPFSALLRKWSRVDLALYFTSYIKSEAERIIRAEEVAVAHHLQRKKPEASGSTGSQPRSGLDRVHTPAQRRPEPGRPEPEAAKRASNFGLLNTEEFPALGAASASSETKGGLRVPAGAHARIASQAPLQPADRASQQGSGRNRRRLAPTPLARVTPVDRFAQAEPAAISPQLAPGHASATVPPVSPTTSQSFSTALRSADSDQSPLHAAGIGSPAVQHVPAASASPTASWASITTPCTALDSPADLDTGLSFKSQASCAGSKTVGLAARSSRSSNLGLSLTSSPGAWPQADGPQSSAGNAAPANSTAGTPAREHFHRAAGSSADPGSDAASISDSASASTASAVAGSPASQWQVSGTPSNGWSQTGRASTPGSVAMRQLPRTPTSVASVTSRFKPKGDDEGPFLAWAAERGNDAPLSGMPRPADASTGSHADIYGQPDQARPALNPATPPATEAAAPPGPLPGRSRRAAVLHAALLRSAAALALSQELEVLLHLLALPQHLKVEPGASADRQPLFPSGDAAAAYACAVLKGSGHAIDALSIPVLEALVECAAVSRHEPDLASGLRQVLDRRWLGAGPPGTDRAAYRSGLAGSSVFELQAFTSDGVQKRSQEEQRRVSNREAVRDGWFSLLRDALGSGDPFRAGSMLSSRAGQLDTGGEAAVLGVLAEGAPALVRRVAPGNLGAFAALFTAALLQAAATGEALLDEELGSLAARDPSRFARLNSRMQAKGGVSRAGSTGQASKSGLGVPRPTVSTADSTVTPATPQSRAQQQQQTLQRRKSKAAVSGAADECAAASLDIAAKFPPAQRLFVLFLEAADSHRLSAHLAQCMCAQLRELVTDSLVQRGARLAQKSEQALAMATLASFLSYLSYGGSAGGPCGPSGAEVDEAVTAAVREGALLWMLPWVAHLYWFQPHDALGRLHSLPSPAILSQLLRLRASPALRPSAASFGPASLCLRSLLDELLQRLPPPPPEASSPAAASAPSAAAADALPAEYQGPVAADRLGSPSSGSRSPPASVSGYAQPGAATAAKLHNHDAAAAAAAATEGHSGRDSQEQACPHAGAEEEESEQVVERSTAVEGELDARYLLLCTPGLEAARQGLQAASPGASRTGDAAKKGAARKITPTSPVPGPGAAPALPAAAVPPEVSAAAAGCSDAATLKLQGAFLAMYSTPDAKVRLRDVVDSVADVLGHTVTAACAEPAAAAAAQEAAAPFLALAQAAATDAASRGSPVTPEVLTALLQPRAHALCSSATATALIAAVKVAVARAETGAVRAVAALAHPSWSDAVIGAAAAIAAEHAVSACARQFVAEVPGRVRALMLGHLEHAVALTIRVCKQQQ